MKSNKEAIYKRQQKILQYLKKNKTVYVEKLASFLEVTPITIRRDLMMFKKKGMVNRFYGGASIVESSVFDDPSFTEPSEKLLKIKHKIAKLAASYIENGDTIFINSSTTALLVLSYLENKHVVVITNNGKALQIQRPPLVELILTGGDVYERKQSLVGEFAINTLNKIIAAKCFMGISGISSDRGITTSVLQETSINSTMLQNCNGPRFVLADSSKVGRNHNFLSGKIEYITNLITDWEADCEEIEKLRMCGVKVDIVSKED